MFGHSLFLCRKCFDMPPAAATALPYPSIGLADFELLDTLGTGSFGRVRLVKFLPAPVGKPMCVGASSSGDIRCSSSSSVPDRRADASFLARPKLALLPAYTKQPATQNAAGCMLQGHCGEKNLSFFSCAYIHSYYALKILKKSEVIYLKQVEHVKTEKKLLETISHPFVVNLMGAFQDDKNLYLMMASAAPSPLRPLTSARARPSAPARASNASGSGRRGIPGLASPSSCTPGGVPSALRRQQRPC